MKTLFRILFFFVLLTQICFGQWEWQNPLPQGNTLRSVKFISSTVGWTVGDFGTILKTTDGGQYWSIQTSGITSALNGVCFTDENNGISVGDEGTILRTTDGGLNWVSQIIGTSLNLRGVSFTDEVNGTVVGGSVIGGGVILRTLDGGQSWTTQINTSAELYGVSFTDTNNGTAVGCWYDNYYPMGTILRTTDGGQSWISHTIGTNTRLWAVCFTSASRGTVVGRSDNDQIGIILRTTDGGQNWVSQISGTTDGLWGVSFIDENNGWVVGGTDYPSSSVILSTTNGGNSWGSQISGTTNWLIGVSFTDIDNGTAVGEFGTILRTTDRGQNWLYQSSEIAAGLAKVQFTNLESGWAVGNSGTILNTTNSGQNWNTQISGTTNSLNDLSFINSNIGTVVGDSGTILRTTNGGINWTHQTSGIDVNLKSVSLIDENNGWAVGFNPWWMNPQGVMLKTTDGGNEWNIIDTLFWYSYIYFIDDTIGWASFDGGFAAGQILKTTDGGINWIPKLSQNLISAFFLNKNIGWIAASRGDGLIKTTDGGENWQIQNSTMYPWDIFFISEYVGWALESGKIFKTTDSGITWTTQFNGTTSGLADISFVDANNGWAVGGNGVILHTTNAGGIVPVELTTFTAQVENQKVILKWTTVTELNNNGFEIQRRVAESDFATIGFVRGEGTTTNQKEYSFIDKDLVDGKYFYRLKQVDYNGTYEYSSVIEVDVRSLNEYALEQNFPNPFNPTTTIGYVLKEKTNAKLILLNAIGEEVSVLVNEEQERGFHKVDFNASTLASGVYFYRLQAGDYVQTRKMILLK